MVDRTEFRQRARRVKRGGVGSSRFDDRAAFSGAMKRPGAMNDRGTNQGKSDCDLLNLVLCLLNGWCFGPGEARATSISRSGSARSEQRSLERKFLAANVIVIMLMTTKLAVVFIYAALGETHLSCRAAAVPDKLVVLTFDDSVASHYSVR